MKPLPRHCLECGGLGVGVDGAHGCGRSIVITQFVMIDISVRVGGNWVLRERAVIPRCPRQRAVIPDVLAVVEHHILVDLVCGCWIPPDHFAIGTIDANMALQRLSAVQIVKHMLA